MIPVEKGLPYIGNLLAYNKDKLEFLSKMQLKNGDTFKVKIGKFMLTVITHPDDIAHVMQGNFNNYIKQSNIQHFFGQSFFFSNGEAWKNKRKIVQPIFKNDHITSFLPLVDKICTEEFATIENNPSVDIQDFFNLVSFKIVTSTIVGKEFQDHYHLKNHFKIVTESLTKMKFQQLSFLYAKENKLSNESKDAIDKTMYKIIAEKKITRNFGTDALSMLIQIQEKENSNLTDADIRDQLVLLIFAGYETTALTMSWISYLLSKNVNHQNILRNEFKAIEAAGKQVTEGPHFSKIDNVIKETMRLYPSGWAWTRIALEADVLRNHNVHAGEVIFISPYLTHRSANYWDDPLTFNPDRFEYEITKGSFIPFGFGPRTCIGMNLAMIEMRLMLKYLVVGFDLIDCNHTPIIKPQMTLDVVNGIKVGIKKRPE